VTPGADLVCRRPEGLYCPRGDFYVDPWRPVGRAVITHAHGDHARAGHTDYLASDASRHVLLARLGDIRLQTVPYGQPLMINGVRVSLHPAGHVLGSAQVRIEHGGAVWVISGDYKTEAESTCAPFEPVRCDVFITESTFGLPIYRWTPQQLVFNDINAWWAANAAERRTSVLFGYSFGKAQRILSGIDAAIGPIVVHGAIDALNRAYQASGVALPQTRSATQTSKDDLESALVLAPPSAAGSPWLRRFGGYSDAFASGWMQVRGARRRRALDRGFVLSDHADWPGLQSAIAATGAERIIVTHGQIAPVVRWLSERGLHAECFATEFGDEQIDDQADAVGNNNQEDSNNTGSARDDDRVE
jgi:putative mRNA 3-end processing factor